MEYAANGQAMTYVMGETWNNDGSGIEDYTTVYAREFRYDGGRQRYMNAELDTATFEPTETIWSDYDGDSVYADFKFGMMGLLTRLTSFAPGIGRVKSPLTYPPDVAYYHGDHIGTTRHLSDASGNAIEPAAYTAFGERVSGTMQDPSQRYGYAGAWGYQTHEDFPFLHVGARYYDPATGRFLQRDPIGIMGGLNVYTYATNSPTAVVDPTGHFGFFGAIIGGIAGAIVGGATGGVSGAISGAIGGAIAGSGAGPVFGAIGGAVSGAINGIVNGESAGKIAGRIAAGAAAGAIGGYIGGSFGSYGGSIGSGAGGAAGSFIGGGLEFYYYDIPTRTYDNMRHNIDRYQRRMAMGCGAG